MLEVHLIHPKKKRQTSVSPAIVVKPKEHISQLLDVQQANRRECFDVCPSSSTAIFVFKTFESDKKISILMSTDEHV